MASTVLTEEGVTLDEVENGNGSVRHHFTVDVEEYFQVSAMEPHIDVTEWDGIASRVRPPIQRLVELLSQNGSRGTFFVLGWLAERDPALVREIAEAGHEVASHGTMHRRVTTLTPEQFREDVRRARCTLEDITGAAVLGYRAPSFSITPEREWALEILVEEGYSYDSSLFPIQRRGYGYPSAERDPYWLRTAAGPLLEIPPATLRRFGKNLPAGGGAYFRLFPLGIIRRAFRESEKRGVPGTFYIHPWELDPEQPLLPVPVTTRLRHYGGLRRTYARLKQFFHEFRFEAIERTYHSMRLSG